MSGDTRISEIRARLEKATLPWTMEWDGQTLYVNDADGDEIVAQTFAIATWEPEYSQQKAECDTASADLIANAPADIAHLLAVHEQQAARIAALEWSLGVSEEERVAMVGASGRLRDRVAALERVARASQGIIHEGLHGGRPTDPEHQELCEMPACRRIRAALAAAAPGDGEA